MDTVQFEVVLTSIKKWADEALKLYDNPPSPNSVRHNLQWIAITCKEQLKSLPK